MMRRVLVQASIIAIALGSLPLVTANALTCPAGFTTLTSSLCKLRFNSNTSWTVPAGVTVVDVVVVGGGGGGGNASTAGGGGGGGGGGINQSQNFSVTPGATITVVIGNGGAIATSGASSSFGSITASGGNRGANASSGGTGGASGTRVSGYNASVGGVGCKKAVTGAYPQGGSGGEIISFGLFSVSPITGIGATGMGGGPTYECIGMALFTSSGSSNAATGGGGGQYSTGSGGTGGSGLVEIRITDPADSIAPTFLNVSSFSTNENVSTSTTVATISVSESATITISGGSDSARFSLRNLDSATAVITFQSSPNFEIPTDVGANNIYEVTISATDSSENVGSLNITITVVDVIEISILGGISLNGSPTKGTSLTISTTSNVAGRAIFSVGGKRIPGCIKKSTTGTAPTFSLSCSFKPANSGALALTISFTANDSAITPTAMRSELLVQRRSGTR